MIAMPPKFVAFDLETTGLNFQKDEIIEIGAVKFSVEVKNGKVIPKLEKEFETFVKPNQMIPAEASKVNNIFDKDVQDAPAVGDAIKKFTAFCGQTSILIAHNANFDATFMRNAYRANPQFIPGNPIVDSLAIARAIMPEAGNHKLGFLAKTFQKSGEIGMNIDDSKMHRAVYDCEMLMEVFVAILRRRLKEKDWEMMNILKSLEKYKGTAQFLNK